MKPLPKDFDVSSIADDPPDFNSAAGPPAESHATLTESPVLTNLSDVEPEDVEWLWPGRLAKGKLTLLIGDPGLGKSFATLDIAARISRGLRWPIVGFAPEGDIVLLSAEDGLADTIRPRVDALEGDPSKIHVIEAIQEDGQDRGVSLQKDLHHIEAVVKETDASLVIVDPLSAYLGSVDAYRDSEVRQVLSPLKILAETTGVSVLAVAHLNKASQQKALYRMGGSIGFIGAARIVLAIASQEDDERRYMGSIKTNISEPAPILAYRLSDGVLVWDPKPVVDLDMGFLLSAGISRDCKEERSEVDEFLKEILSDGSIKSSEGIRQGKELGISRDALNRGRYRLGIKSKRTGGAGGSGYWVWEPPESGFAKGAHEVR